MRNHSSRMRAKLVAFVAVAVLVSGCDPGWGYRARKARMVSDGEMRPHVFAWSPASGVEARASVDVFTSSLTARLEVTNTGTTPLLVQPSGLQVVDEQGRALERARVELTCPGHDEASVTLQNGQPCKLEARFEVDPFWSSLRRITLRLDSLSREGHLVPLVVAMEREGGGPWFEQARP